MTPPDWFVDSCVNLMETLKDNENSFGEVSETQQRFYDLTLKAAVDFLENPQPPPKRKWYKLWMR